MDPLLFGHNEDGRIVAAHLHGERSIRVYFRNGEGVRSEEAPLYPFFFLTHSKYIEGFTRTFWCKELSGNGSFRFLCVFEEWSQMWEAVRFLLDRYNHDAVTKIDSYSQLDHLYMHTDPVTQYLMQTGRTLFKNMAFEELHRMQLDIETYTSPGFRFSRPDRPGDRIILIALSDNRGWKHIIDGQHMSEKEMLLDLVRIIREKDPDVIEGHNIFRFDLPYILKRCDFLKVQPAFGRDGSTPRSFDSRTAYAERLFEYPVTEIAGRHVIDTLMLVRSYDLSRRNMESHGLKYAARYFGIASADRTYIPGEKISWYWDHEPETLKKYALDDVIETGQLGTILSGSSFYLTSLLPYNYGNVVRMGSAAKIESLMVREYLHRKHSLPRPSAGLQTTGGYTNIYYTGVLGPILHVDVESLYPSIMIVNAISPASDELNIFGRLLETLTTMRLKTKRAMKSSTDQNEKSRLDAMQSSFKILINSFYGYLGYARGLFNDFPKADVVTRTGQELLKGMMQSIQETGGKVVEVDTDGIFFVPPASCDTEGAEVEFVNSLSTHLPKGITIAIDGRYRRMLSYKKKNYALLGYDGTITIKGSSLISRSMERFGRAYLKECITCLLNEDFEGLHRAYTRYHEAIITHAMKVGEFARTESLKESLADYSRMVREGRRNKSAPYEIALLSGRAIKSGDRVSYYMTGTDPNVRNFENSKPAEEWDPNFPDENVPFYLKRLNEFSEKFRVLFSPKDYHALFSADDLFPFVPQGVTIITSGVTEEPALEEEEEEDSARDLE